MVPRFVNFFFFFERSQAKYMTLLMSSWTLTARAMAEGERCSSLCWLVDDPSPLLCGEGWVGQGAGQEEEEGEGQTWRMR